MSKQQFKNIREVFLETFSEVYRSDSYNAVYNEFNGWDIETYKRLVGFANAPENQIQNYRLHPLILGASFFKLPNQWHYNEELSAWKIFKNFLGWQDYKNGWRNIFNILKMPFALTFNIVMAVLGTAHNIVRLATEFLPLLGKNIFRHDEKQLNTMLKNMDKNKNDPANSFRPVINFLSFLANLLKKVFMGVHFTGRAITSPIKGVMSAWKSTDDKILAFFKAAASLGITVVVYSFLLPFLPAILANAGFTALLPQIPAISSFLSVIGNYAVLPLIGNTLAAIGASVSPVVTGLALLSAAALTIIGPMISRALDYFNYWWRNSAESGERRQPRNEKLVFATRVRRFFNRLFGSHYPDEHADKIVPHRHVNISASSSAESSSEESSAEETHEEAAVQIPPRVRVKSTENMIAAVYSEEGSFEEVLYQTTPEQTTHASLLSRPDFVAKPVEAEVHSEESSCEDSVPHRDMANKSSVQPLFLTYPSFEAGSEDEKFYTLESSEEEEEESEMSLSRLR